MTRTAGICVKVLSCSLCCLILAVQGLKAPRHGGAILAISTTQVAAKDRAPVRLPEPPTSFLPGGIPKVIHQVFLSGPEELKKEEDSPTSKFRRDWRRSCQVHNPGWRYILWDQAMAEALLKTKYPWFLDVFKALPLVVLRGDAIRPFILHAYGGVYLDMDTECMGSLEDSLSGHSLVLQGEALARVNNAQMASSVGHPFWVMMMNHGNASLHTLLERPNMLFDVRNQVQYDAVLHATGPAAETRLLQSYLGVDNQTTLIGVHADNPQQQHQSATSTTHTTVMVQGLKQWFQACEWNRIKCPVELARCTPVILSINLIRELTKQRTSNHHNHHQQDQQQDSTPSPWLALQPGPLHTRLLSLSHNCDTSARKALSDVPRTVVECACLFGHLVGAHHFSGTWMHARHKKRDYKMMRIQSAKGIIAWLTDPNTFVELLHTANTPWATLPPSPSSPSPLLQSLSQQLPNDVSEGALDAVLWPVMLTRALYNRSQAIPSTSAGRGSWACHMLSITQFSHPVTHLPCCYQSDTQYQSQSLADLARWATTHNCQLTVITDFPSSHEFLAQLPRSPHVAIKQRRLKLPSMANPITTVGQDLLQQQQSMTGGLPDAHLGSKSGQTGSDVPCQTLDAMVDAWRAQHAVGISLDVLHLSGPAETTLMAARALPMEDLPLVLILDLPVLHMSTRSTLTHTYQHLYQELGYRGHYHIRIRKSEENNTQPWEGPPTCAECFVPDRCNASRCLMPSLRLGLVGQTLRHGHEFKKSKRHH